MTGGNLRQWRECHGLLRPQLAHMIDVNASTIRWWEGENVFGDSPHEDQIPEEFLVELAQIFQCTLEELNSPPAAEKKTTSFKPTVSITTEDIGSYMQVPGMLIRSEPRLLEEPCARIGVELGESIEATEGGQWKRVRVYVEYPTAKKDWNKTVEEASAECQRILGQELTRTYGELAAQFNTPKDLRR